MGREAIEIYPYYAMKAADFAYNIVKSKDVPFSYTEAFLAGYRPHLGQFFGGALQGEPAKVIKAEHLTQQFYGELNLALGLDYLEAFQATGLSEYSDKVFYYLDKAIKEQNEEAMYVLTQFLFDRARELENNVEVLQHNPELSLWLGERFWYLQYLLEKSSGNLKERVTQYYRSLQASCRIDTSQRQRSATQSMITQHHAFSYVFSPALKKPGSSLRGHETLESIDARDNYEPVHWLKHNVPEPDEQQRRYFGKDLLRYQKLAVVLEVWVAEMWRVLVGEPQPRSRISRDSLGRYYSLSEIISTRANNPHLSGYESGLRHAGRVMSVKELILFDNDPHALNLLVTVKDGEFISVGIDGDKGCWSIGAFFEGSENHVKETTIPAKENSLVERYDRERCTVSYQYTDDPFARTYYLNRTNDDMGEWTVGDYESFPMAARHRLVRRAMFNDSRHAEAQAHARAFYDDPAFKAEQHFMQLKSSCLRSSLLPRALLDTVLEGEEDVKHHLIFDLERKRIQQRKILKSSNMFYHFLGAHKEKLCYAILFEITKFCRDNRYLAKTDYYSEETLLVSIIKECIVSFKIMGLEISVSQEADLIDYQACLRSNELTELRKGVGYLEREVLPFYHDIGMVVEERACLDYMKEMKARITRLQIAKNQGHAYYKRAANVWVGLVAQKARIFMALPGFDFAGYELKREELGNMLDALSQSGEIDWARYADSLIQMESYLKYLTEAADLAQIYQFYSGDVENNKDACKALLLKMILPFIAMQITKLTSAPTESELSYAQALVKFCVFVLSLRRNEIIDNMRIAFNKLFGSQQSGGVIEGTKGFWRWRNATKDLEMQGDALKQTVSETTQYNNKTSIAFANTTCITWASFHQVFHPSNGMLNEDVVRAARVVTCSA